MIWLLAHQGPEGMQAVSAQGGMYCTPIIN
jgi:hypothetical protein